MDILQQHEKFEIEVLDLLHRSRILDPLVFGGGTMLRLCHELNRYSVDLDFWFIKEVQETEFFANAKQLLAKNYELTDSQIKNFSMILELRSTTYPKRLKIEIRRKKTDMDFQESIAFSRFSTHQVLIKALTLEQSMKNKVSAFLDRGEIRDSFDIEFLLRRGIELPHLDQDSLERFQNKLNKFKQTDFKVKLYIGAGHAQILYFSGVCLFEGKTAIPVRIQHAVLVMSLLLMDSLDYMWIIPGHHQHPDGQATVTSNML